MDAHDDFRFHGLLRAVAELCDAVVLVKDLGGHSVCINRSFQLTADLNHHTVVGSATTGHQGIEAFLRVRPDVTLMDLRFRDMSGIDVIAAIRRESPDARSSC
jgi:DNA-binding NarL/FixJ family response regulator